MTPDGAKGAHIGIAHPVKEPHAPTGEASRRQLMPGDASRLALAARTRSDHEVVAAGADRLDQPGDILRIVGTVAVHEHDDVGVLGRHRCRKACPAITGPGIDHVRTGGAGPLRGGVAAAAVRHDDTGDDRAREAAHHIRDRLLLIERRDDDDNGARFSRSALVACKRRRGHSKAPAQAAVCAAPRRLVR